MQAELRGIPSQRKPVVNCGGGQREVRANAEGEGERGPDVQSIESRARQLPLARSGGASCGERAKVPMAIGVPYKQAARR